MSVQRALLRARQVKALYQRELTALHRDPGIAPDELPAREAALRQQAVAKLAELREEAERAGPLDEAQRAAFDAPGRPTPGAALTPDPSPGARERGDD